MQIPSDSLFATHPLMVARKQKEMLASQNSGFVELLSQGIGKVNQMQGDAGSKVEKLLAGDEITPRKFTPACRKLICPSKCSFKSGTSS